ncbi:MAG TPA: hypothetical protein VM099_00530 [Gemmatimonadaceae bacterium]|nr:hypothetical protein [Gemmatimonadaceae bacterium]
MRTNSRFVLISAAGLIVAACSGKDSKMSDDLKKDLDQASTSDGLALASPASKGSQVVSAIEQANPPAPRQVAPSRRVAKHKAAPTRTPAPVETQNADVSEEVAEQPAQVEPAPVEPAPTQSPRPRPVAISTGGGSTVGRGGGSGLGTILGGISIVLRGGGVDGDACDPRTDGRHVPISINSRIPQGTFPGSGRIGRR